MVIAIIAVLVSLTFIGLQKARESADKTVTTGTLREIQVASGIYATDNNGRFVAASGKNENGGVTQAWFRNREFLDIFRGESNPNDQSTEANTFPKEKFDRRAALLRSVNWDSLKGNYGAFEKDPSNATWGSGEPWVSSFSLTQLATPELTAAFGTRLDWRLEYGGRANYTGDEKQNGQGRIAYRHGNKALIVFYDGHVEALSKVDMQQIDDNGGIDNPFWNGSH